MSLPVVIIGEGPGEQEDITGLPFVGRAGKMLDTALSSVDIDPLEDCYITNIVKCRPLIIENLALLSQKHACPG